MNDKNRKLIKALELIGDYELMKPIDKIDGDVIDATVNWSLRLQNKDITLSTEEIEKMVSMIPFDEKEELHETNGEVPNQIKVLKKNKILFIAAIIAILVTLLTIVSVAFEWNIFEELKNRFGTVADTPTYQEQIINGITVYSSGKNRNYDTIEEALKSENVNILYPSKLPDGVKLRKISFYDELENKKVMFSFEGDSVFLEIYLNKSLGVELINTSTKTEEINDMMCYFCIKDDIEWVQVYFENNGVLYEFSGTNERELTELIENLKGLE